MREIKFRVWNKKGQRWYKGAAIQLAALHGDSFGLSEGNSKVIELSQYTGIKDKNGVEIYEGDFLTNPTIPTKKRTYSYVVWHTNCACWGFTRKADSDITPLFFDGSYLATEIIGNIYENPDLLEQKN